MNKIVCPHCKKEFELSEPDYLSIIEQVKDGEFEKLLHEKEEQIIKDKNSEIALLKSESKYNLEKALLEKENQISKLSQELKAKETEKQFEITKAVNDRDMTINTLKNAIEKDRKSVV